MRITLFSWVMVFLPYAVYTTYPHTWFWQHGSYKIPKFIVAKDEVRKAQLRPNYMIMSYNLRSMCICSTAKLKLILLLCTHVYSYVKGEPLGNACHTSKATIVQQP